MCRKTLQPKPQVAYRRRIARVARQLGKEDGWIHGPPEGSGASPLNDTA